MQKIAMIFLVIALLAISLRPISGEDPQDQLLKTNPTQEEFIRERIRSMSVFEDANARKNMQSYLAKIKERAEWFTYEINSYNLKVKDLQKVPLLYNNN